MKSTRRILDHSFIRSLIYSRRSIIRLHSALLALLARFRCAHSLARSLVRLPPRSQAHCGTSEWCQLRNRCLRFLSMLGGLEQSRIGTSVPSQSLIRSLFCSQRALVCLLRIALLHSRTTQRSVSCSLAHSLARSLAPELMGQWDIMSRIQAILNHSGNVCCLMESGQRSQ